MSANRISLSSRPLIAVVVVLLAAVVFVNVRTFGPRGARAGGSSIRVQAAPPYPIDLDEVLSAGRDATVAVAGSALVAPPLRRDPFTTEPQTAGPVARVAEARGKPAAKRAPLRCEAVFPAGQAPLAVISGRSYRVGDPVAGYRIEAIGIAGVKLARGDGRSLFLEVGATPGAGEQSTNGLVTSLKEDKQDGSTRLAAPERKLP